MICFISSRNVIPLSRVNTQQGLQLLWSLWMPTILLPCYTQSSPKGLIYQETVVAGANIIHSPTLIHSINADWINNSSRCVTCQWHEPILCVTILSSSYHGGNFFTLNVFQHGKEPLLIVIITLCITF